ncbi:hypothetical protein PSTT_01585 [Puccinia striiformis]|uniref:Uncharacterized protein n=1 Tax=Puccinia striiformis TaxID=27350 RepID=A0A2S4W2Y2_9BASI|nr:hypothetical protein PSTT_01585 [Puccinia striiformis]
MQARTTILTFILVFTALAGLASPAPPSSAGIVATPATHEKEATPATASGSTGNVAEKKGTSGQTADAHTAGQSMTNYVPDREVYDRSVLVLIQLNREISG